MSFSVTLDTLFVLLGFNTVQNSIRQHPPKLTPQSLTELLCSCAGIQRVEPTHDGGLLLLGTQRQLGGAYSLTYMVKTGPKARMLLDTRGVSFVNDLKKYKH